MITFNILYSESTVWDLSILKNHRTFNSEIIISEIDQRDDAEDDIYWQW